MAKSAPRRIAPHIAVVNGTPTTTSRDIAETFGKRHDDVLKRIKSLDCSPVFRLRNFAEASYDVAQPNGGKNKYTEYRITRDGFAFLCMGFTGAKAAKWKERYIATFNKLADKVAARIAVPSRSAPVALPAPTPAISVQTLSALIQGGLVEPQALIALAEAATKKLYFDAAVNPNCGYGQEVARKIKADMSWSDLHAINVAASLEVWMRIKRDE